MFNWSIITQNFDILLRGLYITLIYTMITTVLGLAFGFIAALMRLSSVSALRWVNVLFIEFFRNVPLLVWLLWSSYALPIFLGINIDKQTSGILALSLYGASYYAEIIRAGIQSLPSGQFDAAKAIGMSGAQSMRRIILPQAVRRMIPPLAGQTIIQMKNTTLLSIITVPDLLYEAGYISSVTYSPMEVYTAVGVIFLAILVPCNWAARKLEAPS